MPGPTSLSLASLLLSLLLLSLPPPSLFQSQPHAMDSEQLESAVQGFRWQLRENPDDLNAAMNLAVSLQQLNLLRPDGGRRIPEAEKMYRHVIASTASLPDTQFVLMGNLAALLFEGGRPRESVELLHRALEVARINHLPSSSLAGLYFNRGKALASLGKLIEADSDYMKSADSAYGNDAASFAKALAAMREIPAELAERARVVAIQVHWLRESQNKGLLAKPYPRRTQSKQEVPTAIASCSPPSSCSWLQSMQQADLSWLHFALHKARDQQKLYKDAWEELSVANAVMLPLQQYDIGTEETTFNTILNVFDTGGDGQWGHGDSTPIFVVGLPRSGSTLVEQILATHTDVYAAGEDTAFAPLVGEVNRGITEAGSDIQAQAEVLSTYGRKYVELMRARIPPGLPQPKKIVDKMLRNLWLLGYVDRMLPKACLVIAARHPLDAGLSCYQQPFGYHGVSWSWSLEHIAHQVKLTWELVKHWRKVLPGKVLTVHYELLVEFPEAVSRKLLTQCGLEWQPRVLDFHKAERTVQTASVTQVRKPMYKSSVSRWKRYERQLQPLVKAVQQVVREYEAELEHERRVLQEGAASMAEHEEL